MEASRQGQHLHTSRRIVVRVHPVADALLGDDCSKCAVAIWDRRCPQTMGIDSDIGQSRHSTARKAELNTGTASAATHEIDVASSDRECEPSEQQIDQR